MSKKDRGELDVIDRNRTEDEALIAN